jgi:hypothetical protein
MELWHLAQVEEHVGPGTVEVEPDHDVGSALYRKRIRVLGLEP